MRSQKGVRIRSFCDLPRRSDGICKKTRGTLRLTGDSYVTEFIGDAANVISNGCTLYVNGAALTGTK